MRTFDEFYSEFAHVVQRTARREHKACPSVTAEDVEQQVWLVLGTKLSNMEDWEEAQVQGLASKIARGFLTKERLDYMYFSGDFLYSTKDVRRILDESTWTDLTSCPDVEGRVDIRTAFKQLTSGQQRALFRQYALREEPLGGPKGAEQKARERAVDALTHLLNTRSASTRERIDLDLINL